MTKTTTTEDEFVAGLKAARAEAQKEIDGMASRRGELRKRIRTINATITAYGRKA